MICGRNIARVDLWVGEAQSAVLHACHTIVGVPVDRPVIENCVPELSKGEKKSLSSGLETICVTFLANNVFLF